MTTEFVVVNHEEHCRNYVTGRMHRCDCQPTFKTVPFHEYQAIELQRNLAIGLSHIFIKKAKHK
jgi:hypothetical protein